MPIAGVARFERDRYAALRADLGGAFGVRREASVAGRVDLPQGNRSWLRSPSAVGVQWQPTWRPRIRVDDVAIVVLRRYHEIQARTAVARDARSKIVATLLPAAAVAPVMLPASGGADAIADACAPLLTQGMNAPARWTQGSAWSMNAVFVARRRMIGVN